MGAAWMSRGKLVRQTSEVIGYKAGLALTRNEFNDIMSKEYEDIWKGPDQEFLRIRSEEYEGLIAHLLYAVGNTSSPDMMTDTYLAYKYFETPLFPLFEEVCSGWHNLMKQKNNPHYSEIEEADILPFVQGAAAKHGKAGFDMAKEVIDIMRMQLHISPFSDVRSVDWKDTAELASLFKSKSLDTQYGTFFDQRFIDFLGQNFERIGDIHWRKFEALTCEFFKRHGYYVEIGQGSDDGGIDARAWLKDSSTGNPPAVLIQCKRRKDKVEMGVVKALYADVLHENANRGLIVTTRDLSPSANEVRLARGYPIDKADRSTLKKWIEVMRKPGNGIFM
ncbi:MAG: restriction endonuclease [Paenibacillus sp.]|nr:restriction endonuclease [Paenibacillus sp.]